MMTMMTDTDTDTHTHTDTDTDDDDDDDDDDGDDGDDEDDDETNVHWITTNTIITHRKAITSHGIVLRCRGSLVQRRSSGYSCSWKRCRTGGIEAEGASGAGAPRTLIDSFIVASITGDAARKRGVCYRLATKNSGKHVNLANF